jgi:hypothetical protein
MPIETCQKRGRESVLRGALPRIPPRQEKRGRVSEMLARKGAGNGRLWVFAQGYVWGEAWWRAVTVGERV